MTNGKKGPSALEIILIASFIAFMAFMAYTLINDRPEKEGFDPGRSPYVGAPN